MKASLVGPIWLTIAYLVGGIGALVCSLLPAEVHGITTFSLEGVSGRAAPKHLGWFRIGLWAVAASFALQIMWVWWDWCQH